jgi:hypothetical protein
MATKRTDHSIEADISAKLNVLIALSIKQLLGDSDLGASIKRKTGVSNAVHFLSNMGLNATDIAQIVGSPVTSVRTLLTPTRRR